MSASSKLAVVLILAAASACASDRQTSRLEEIRSLPEPQRTQALHGLTEAEKIEIFFAAARRHPPETRLHPAFAGEGGAFFGKLRLALDERGGIPEVLSFLTVVGIAMREGTVRPEEAADLRLDTVCDLAKRSNYCPELRDSLIPQATE